MLAYTIRSPVNTGAVPYIRIGQGGSSQVVKPGHPADNSYWIVILDANRPTTKVQEWVVPGQNNTAVPQGAFYDYLARYGAGRELQKLEQVSSHTQTGYGLYSYVSYILAGQSGPPGAATDERAGLSDAALLLMSLMPLPSGQPPYSICDSYPFVK